MSGFKCANCGKGVMYGHNVSHAKNRTRKIFKPNLHNFKGMRLCTKCLRKIKSQIKPSVSVSQPVSTNV